MVAVFGEGGYSSLEQKVFLVEAGGALGSDLYGVVVGGVGQESLPGWGVRAQLGVLGAEVWGEPESQCAYEPPPVLFIVSP